MTDPSEDVHNNETAATLADYYLSVSHELATQAATLGIRPTSLQVGTLFSSNNAELAIPSGDTKAVDAMGESYGLDLDLTTPTLYQRGGPAQVAGFEVFVRVFTYLIPPDAVPVVPAAAEIPGSDQSVILLSALPPIPAQPVSLPAETVPSA